MGLQFGLSFHLTTLMKYAKLSVRYCIDFDGPTYNNNNYCISKSS